MENNAFVILAALGAFMFVFAIIGVVFYILASIGLYKLAQNANIPNPWLAWIPIVDLYILGLLIKSVKVSTYEIPKLELVLPLGCIAVNLFDRVPVIGFLLQIAYYILILLSLYKLYSMYRPQDATLWTILSIFAFPIPILLYIMRNDRPVSGGNQQL